MNSAGSRVHRHDGDLKAGSGSALRRRALHAGARLLQLAEGAGDRSRRATTTGPTATARRTAASTRSSGSTTSGRSSSARRSRSGSTGCARRCRRRRSASASTGRPVRREPALDVRRRHLRDAERAGLVQQPLRHRTRPGRVRRAQRCRTSPGCRRPSREATAGDSAAVMLIAQADPGCDDSDGDPRAAARPEDARARPTASPTASRRSCGAARRGDRLPQAGRLRARRLALLPRRQAAPRRAGARLENFTPRRDVRRQPGRTATTTCTG